MTTNTKFYKLLEPGVIGQVKTRNRIFKTSAGTTLGDASGRINNRHRAFYGAIAKGGAGLIFVEGCNYIRPEGEDVSSGGNTFLRFDDDTFIDSLRELTGIIHKYHCPTFLQLMLGGPSESAPGVQPASSSALTAAELRERQPYHKTYLTEDTRPSRELSIEEIQLLRNKLIEAAIRAAKAGFDGVELNGGNGHLLNAFHSRVWNRRQDEYGCQDLNNRTRFTVETIQAIKKSLGRDYPVTVNFNMVEYGIDDATTLAEGLGMAKIFEKAGADAILGRTHGYRDVTMDVIWPERIFIPEPPDPLPKDMDWSHFGAGAHIPLAAALKKVITVPVLVAGRIDPVMAEKALEEGKADFIGMTRRLQADPELPNKVAANKLDDIAPCTACSHCLEANRYRWPVHCRINAALGGEQEYVIKPAANKKRVVVIGGGPAGLEAARVSAIRGHEVWLYDKEKKLGGLMPVAAMVKGTEIEDLPAMASYLEGQVKKLGVRINLGKPFDPAVIQEIKPDVVIVATGGVPTIPNIPGINRRNVVNGGSLHHQLKLALRFFNPEFLRSLTKFWMPLGKNVVIIGGAIQGCELAEFLVKRGRKVTIVDEADELGILMPIRNRIKTLKWLSKKGAVMITGAKYLEITDKGLTILTKDGQKQVLAADTIATALPLQPDMEIFKELQGKAPQVLAIGDCNEPRLIIQAVADGYRIGSAI